MSMKSSRVLLRLKCDPKKSRVKVAEAKECDMNNIMKTYMKTGRLPDMVQRSYTYGDVSDVPSYQDALNLIASAHEQFMSLPSELRSRFKNDPAEYLAFMNDENNREEARKLNLLREDVPVTPPVEPVVGGAESAGGVK